MVPPARRPPRLLTVAGTSSSALRGTTDAVESSSSVDYAPHRPPAHGRLRHAARRLQEKATVRAYRATSWLLGHLPMRATVAVARVLFLAAYVVWPSKRRFIGLNAGHILGVPPDAPEARRLARRIYGTYAHYVVELMRLPTYPPEHVQGLVSIQGDRGIESFRDIYDEIRDRGHAVIVTTAHVGSIEALAAGLATQGLPIYGVADDSAYPELYDLLAEQRRRWGVEVVGWHNLREMYRILRRRAVLALLVDWGYRADGIPVRLFGAWTTLPAGPAVLAAKSGASIVPVVNHRLPDGSYAAEHGDVIEVRDGSPAEILRATQAVADALERMIRHAPEQWYTFKPMWPERAEEAAALEARAAEMAARTDGDGRIRARARRAARTCGTGEAGDADGVPNANGATDAADVGSTGP